MGYTTDFQGSFTLNRPLTKEQYLEISQFIDGYYDENFKDKYKMSPGTHCHWEILEDRRTIEWDQGEKFYCYVEWLEFLIKTYFEPWGYKVNGEVTWRGEEFEDIGTIKIKKNVVKAMSYCDIKDKLKERVTEQEKMITDLKIELEHYTQYSNYLEEHIKWMPDGELALSAKDDFMKRIV